MNDIKVYFDYQAFTHQHFGGVSRYFAEIIARLPQYGIEPIVGLRFSSNTHLKAFRADIEPEIDVEKQFLPRWKNRRQKLLLFKILAHLFPQRYPYPKYVNRLHCNREIRQQQFDVLHATYFDPYVLKANRNRPLIITIHDMIDEVFGEGHHIPKRKALLAQQCDHIIAVSEHTKQDIIRLLGVPADKISVVYHGCGLSKVQPKHIPPVPPKYILYVGGRHRKYKNFPLFLQAMQRVLREQNDIDLLCVGLPFSIKEKKLISDLGLDKRVHAYFAADDELHYIYKHALCMVFPSCYEGFGLPILEAWEADCPLILSRSSCFPEIAGDAALFFEENNVEDLYRVTTELLQSDTLQETIVNRARERRELYSWQRAAKETAEVYKKVYAAYAKKI